MQSSVLPSFLLSLLLLVASPIWAAAYSFTAPLDTAATASALAAKSPLLSVAVAGKRIVAVGQRGHIVYSDDGGQTWTQAKVPVSTDLVAVSFPTPQKGWAVGHGGVVIHTVDAGQTWVRQLDGKRASILAVEYFRAQQGAANGALLRQAEGQLADSQAGAIPPFLDVFFESETSGFVVGAFNRIFRTEDGGQTWQPWIHHVDNPSELHFYSVRRSGDQIYMTGEQGVVWRLEATTNKFVRIPTPYKGTLFGAVVTRDVVLAFGMNGTVFRTTDQGKNWIKVGVGSRAGINGGLALTDGRIFLINSGGEVLQSSDQGKSFTVANISTNMSSYFGIASVSDREFALVGINGVRVAALP